MAPSILRHGKGKKKEREERERGERERGRRVEADMWVHCYFEED
jgi:hypothetical protein